MSIRNGFRRFKHNAGITWQTFRADLGFGTPAPDSDFWYSRPGFHTAAGAYVSPETAMRLAAVFACFRVISETVGSLPLVIYRRRKGGGHERADDHPLSELLQAPNEWQTGMEFWEMMQGHVELRGNAFAHIISGNGRAIDQLLPLHPDRVRVFRLPNNRLRYEVTSLFNGQIEKLSQEEVFHLRGISVDGIMGISTVTAMAEVIGTGLARQEYGARFFSNNAKPGIAIKTQKLTDESRIQLQKSMSEGYSGSNAFKTLVLPPGMDIVTLGLTNKDSQLIELSQATRTDIASAFRLPPHKIGDLSRGTFSNIEQQNIEFATDSIRPRVIRLERRIDRDLIKPLQYGSLQRMLGGQTQGDYFASFEMDALFRGDLKSRYEAYNQALQYWLTVDEVRAMEGKNPMGGVAQKLLRPINVGLAENPTPGTPGADTEDAPDTEQEVEDSEPGAEPTPDSPSAARVRALAIASAGRIVRREVKGLREIVSKNLQPAELSAAIDEFYTDTLPLIAETMVISKNLAMNYYLEQRGMLLSAKTQAERESAIDFIEEQGAAILANLALSSTAKGEQHALRTSRR